MHFSPPLTLISHLHWTCLAPNTAVHSNSFQVQGTSTSLAAGELIKNDSPPAVDSCDAVLDHQILTSIFNSYPEDCKYLRQTISKMSMDCRLRFLGLFCNSFAYFQLTKSLALEKQSPILDQYPWLCCVWVAERDRTENKNIQPRIVFIKYSCGGAESRALIGWLWCSSQLSPRVTPPLCLSAREINSSNYSILTMTIMAGATWPHYKLENPKLTK